MDALKKRKIIFLDIDGVLASPRVDVARVKAITAVHEFDPIAVGMINALCKTHDADIVIASSWASGNEYTRETLLEYFRKAGFHGDFHEDWRIDQPAGARGPSIARWCEAHDIDASHYIIMDDSVKSLNAAQRKKHIRPDAYDGLQFRDYLKADALLGNRVLRPDELKIIASAKKDTGWKR